MAVDFLILTADSDIEFIIDPERIAKDVRKINLSMYEFHTYVGMRTLGPSKVAWAARQHGYTSQVLSKLQLIQVDEIIKLCEPFVNEKTIIGIGTSLIRFPTGGYLTEEQNSLFSPSSVVYKFIKTIEHFRNKYQTKIIVGGSQASAFQQIFKGDYVIDGEAENKLPQLLDQIRRGGIQKKPYNWQITSCNFKWHDTDFIVNKEPLPLETSRGCIFRCRFCSFSNIGKKVGTFERPLECIRQELIDNYDKYRTTHYWFADDTFNDNDERVNQFCEMVESLPFRISFMGYMRLDLAHRFQKTTKRLFDAGLVGCSIGIESFHPTASKAVGKAFSSKHGKQFLEYLYHDMCGENIVINCCNIVGLPGETEEHLQHTLEWYKKRPYIHTNWSALTLHDPKRAPKEYDRSVFELEAEKYRYQFFDDKPMTYWKSPIMDSVKAIQLRQKILKQMKPVNVDAGEPWLAMHYLSVLGITPKQARKIGWLNLYLNKTSTIQSHNFKYFDKVRDHNLLTV